MQDIRCLLGEDQDLSQAAGNYLGDFSYDTGDAGRPILATMGGGTVDLDNDQSKGNPLFLEVVITQTFTSGGAATVQIQAVQADNGALSSNLEVLAQTDAIGYATLIAGKKYRLAYDNQTKRYIGVRFVIATATTTAGTATSHIGSDGGSNYKY